MKNRQKITDVSIPVNCFSDVFKSKYWEWQFSFPKIMCCDPTGCKLANYLFKSFCQEISAVWYGQTAATEPRERRCWPRSLLSAAALPAHRPPPPLSAHGPRLPTRPDGAAAAAPPPQMWLPPCRTPFREQRYWFWNNGPFIFHLFFSFQQLAFSYSCFHGPVSKPAQYL